MRFFVYSTLKQGFANHFRLASGTEEIIPARVHGRMYGMGWDFPILELPPRYCYLSGSMDYAGDLLRFSLLNHLAPQPEPCGDWDTIDGELMTFEVSMERIREFDYLEGFDAGESSLYVRVATRVQCGAGFVSA